MLTLLALETSSELCITLRSMSLIHLMTRWLVQTTGSRSRFSHWVRRACIFCRECIIFFNITNNISYFQSECDSIYKNDCLFVKVEHLQKLNGWQNAGNMELVGDVKDGLQVSPCDRVQHSAIHQLVVEDLGVLGKPDITQPALRHPVMIHISSFGKSEGHKCNTKSVSMQSIGVTCMLVHRYACSPPSILCFSVVLNS